MSPRLVVSPRAQARRACARDWLRAHPPSAEVLVVATRDEAARALIREALPGTGAAFGWQSEPLARLAARLAAEALARAGEVAVGALAGQAVMARVVHRCAKEGTLGRFAEAADGPGLVRALANAVAELRFASADAGSVRAVAPELARVHDAFTSALAESGLADRARVFALARDRARDPAPHPVLDRPLLLLDLEIGSRLEQELVAALAARAPDALATVCAGDAASEAWLAEALEVAPETLPAEDESVLGRLQAHLFEDTTPEQAPLGEEVAVLSAPGESRECVELARRLHALAAEGVPFDEIAVLLRSTEAYRAHLVEALRRAGIPAHFARGAVEPDPAGRAFMALLACAAENLSARRFAEYLSLDEVPSTTTEGAPPDEAPRAERWIAPDEEMLPAQIAAGIAEATEPEDVDEPDAAPAAPPDGRVPAPRRWESLLVDAAVIGGLDRWERRLDGRARELALDLEALDDPDDPQADRLRREAEHLETLKAFAMPLLAVLDSLPGTAAWGEWLDALSALASRALRRPERVLKVMGELAPMADVGPVGLAEVQLVLSQRLLELSRRPEEARYGKVFVAPVEAARGLAFDVVFVPGLAERLFPKKLEQEPILLDDARRKIGALPTREDRLVRERLALRIAVGAARRRVVLSYPRLDLDQSRPRVPSFYTLEALRAASGRLPGFDDLARAAERVTAARVGWPAPADPADAIDEAEHDLALLERLLGQDPEESIGTARFLLSANPHLGRALRFRARRWLDGWTPADGLVKPSEAGAAAIAAHGLGARSFSPTALQNFASCPYKFFLYAVHRLSPREVPEAIEEMPPLQKGSMVHEVQFALFGRLRDAGLLPVSPGGLEAARAHLDAVLDETAARYRDELAPAIERVWEDGVESVRADLREWLRRTSEDPSGFVPWLFELSFGLAGRREQDPHSSDEPVALDCGIALRGSIDLVERQADGARVRVTDHKTGRKRVSGRAIVDGGRSLKPVLYALATEKLFPESTVESGRLYYCTSTGGFEDVVVPLDADARASAATVADTIGQALAEPFLPAAPDRDACRWCDYRVVCGPYEELRTRRKWKPPLEPLHKLRDLS